MYRFKECREAKGFSQKYVALSLDVKAPSVSEWENGKSNPTLENLIALSKLLNVSCDELLGQNPVTGSISTSAIPFDPSESQLLEDFRQLSIENKKSILKNIRFLINEQLEEKRRKGEAIV